MTDLPASKPVDLKAVLSGSSPVRTVAADDHSEGMSYLESLPRRLVTLYLPLGIIVFILLFPFYLMGLTSVKPDERLLDLETFSPFWVWHPDVEAFPQAFVRELLSALVVEHDVCGGLRHHAFDLCDVLAAYAIVRLRSRGAFGWGLIFLSYWCRRRSCSFRSRPWCFSTACSICRLR